MMSVAEKKVLRPGKYTTRTGRLAIVDTVADGILIGRYNLGTNEDPHWMGCVWQMDGRRYPRTPDQNDIGVDIAPAVERIYWLNIYDDGPGLLRKTWEESLIEASCQEKQPLCRVEVCINSYVGEGLK